MLRLTLSVFFGAILLLFINSCTFDPDGDILTEIEIPQPTPTTIDFFSSQDTLVLRNFAAINFSARTIDPIKGYKVLVDGEVVTEGDGNPPSNFSLHTREFVDGLHTLTLVITKRYMGESMASQMGLELYEDTFSRKIEIFNKPIVAPPVTASIENGVLVLRWEPYTGYRFDRYNVFSLDPYEYHDIRIQNQNSLQIPNFTGGKARFKFTLYAFNESDTTSVTYETSHGASIERTENSLIYKWNANPFSNSTGFRISLDVNGTHQEISFENEATVYEHPILFDFPYEVSTAIIAVTNNQGQASLTSRDFSTEQKIGGTNPRYYRYRQFIKHPTIDSLLLIHFTDDLSSSYSEGRIVLYNSDTGKEIDMRVGEVGVSPDGSHIYHYGNGYVSELDPTDLSQKSGGVSFRDLTGQVSISTFYVSDDNKLMLFPYQLGVKGTYYFYDPEAKQLRFTIPAENYNLTQGTLGNGGTWYYNDNGEVLLFDTDPFSRLKLTTYIRQLPLSHVHQAVGAGSTGLAVFGHPPLGELRQASYTHAVIRMFANRQNEFGVVYSSGGKVKIDFFDHRDLTLLTTFVTQIPGNMVNNYVFSLVDNELFVHRYYNYENGPVHRTTIKFR